MGKGKSSAPSTVDTSAFDSAMGETNLRLAEYQQKLGDYELEASELAAADTPEIETVDTVDWSEKMETLNSKMEAEYGLEGDDAKGRLDTIKSQGSLLDDEEVETTTSLLTGA